MEIKMKHVERKKRYGKNKDLWREIAVLMTELAKLKREKKEWEIVSAQLDAEEDAFHILKDKHKTLMQSSLSQSELQIDSGKSEDINIAIESKVKSVVDDISISADRITQALESIIKLIESTATIQEELYDKYSTEHQFRGYEGISESAGSLIRQFVQHTPEN